jgi:hypothetical protein
MEIKKEIQDKTQLCKKGFCCLRDENVCCNVVRCVNKDVHFVECGKTTLCNYRLSFGMVFICTCPTRKEIHNKYGI